MGEYQTKQKKESCTVFLNLIPTIAFSNINRILLFDSLEIEIKIKLIKEKMSFLFADRTRNYFLSKDIVGLNTLIRHI